MDRVQAAKYLPVFLNKKTVHHELGDGNNKKLVKVLLGLFPESVSQTARISAHFKGDTEEETARNIYNFLQSNFTYKADYKLHQVPRLPNALIEAGKGDCKSYALFAAAVMYNIYGSACLEFASDIETQHPTHIYCVYKNIVIDGTFPIFNRRMPVIKYKKKYNMKIESISGYQNDGINSWLGDQIRRVKKQVKAEAKYAKEWGKKVGFTIPRQAFLLLVSLNVRSYARKLAANRSRSLIDWDNKVGGQKSALNKAINDGLKKKPILGQHLEMLNSGCVPVYPIGDGGLASIAASIAAAVPVIVAMNDIIRESKELVGNVTPAKKEEDKTPFTVVVNSGEDKILNENSNKPDYIKPLLITGAALAVLKITKII